MLLLTLFGVMKDVIVGLGVPSSCVTENSSFAYSKTHKLSAIELMQSPNLTHTGYVVLSWDASELDLVCFINSFGSKLFGIGNLVVSCSRDTRDVKFPPGTSASCQYQHR